ncbi:MAG: hypothetical protein H7Y10_00970 [Flavobacterium sp.]|nr:hypothetical protein [Flavobacterium sp.]
MKKAINKITLISILFLGLVSCENNGYEDFKQESTPSVALNGEWYIDVIKASNGSVQVQHALHKTFDSNDGKMWIDDIKHGWWLKGKLNVNPANLTFDVSKEANLNDPGTTFTITEGKIIKNAAKSKTGVVVDSIYFKAEFSYEPGVIYIHAGHKRTGLLEDDY